jgi:hypothetical protein
VLSLLMLTHCGGSMNEEAQAPEAPGPLAPVTREQELATILVFSPSADARVEAERPTTNFGSSSMIGADLSPRMESYLRFNVSGVAGVVSSARLRLYATDSSSDGPRVYRTAGGWTEAGLTWNTRPALVSGALDDKGAVSSGTWVEFDVTSAVSGNGELNLALIATSGDGTDFASRESSSTSLRPQLVITFSPVGCMPRRERYTEWYSPSADAYVSPDSPSSNFGRAPLLLVDGSPRLESYLQFDVSTSGLSLLGARLELFALDPTSNGPLLYRTSTGWSETALTWNTRPSLLGSPLGNLGAISAGSWVSYNLTGVVTGPGPYGFGLIPESGDGVDFASRDASDFTTIPRLLLTVETPPYCSYRGAGGGLTGWARQIGGVGPEQLRALATDSGGGFVAAGLFGDAVFPHGEGFALARYATDGRFLWGRVLATDDVFVQHLTVTPQGHIFVVGTYDGSPDLGTGPLPPVPDGPDARVGRLFFARFSPEGALLWVRTPNSGNALPAEVATDSAGNLILTGSYRGTPLDLGGGPLPANSYTPSGFIAKFSPDGQHLWSRSFTTEREFRNIALTTAAVDPAGNIYIGGMSGVWAVPEGEPLGSSGLLIAKYSPTGSLLWTRLFTGWAPMHRIVSVRPLGSSAVAFTANLGGTFTFGGNTYTVEGPDEPYAWAPFIGTLSAAGEDGWIRPLGRDFFLDQLATGPGGTLTVSGQHSGMLDLGGGPLGYERLIISSPFVARYSSSGSHLWSRTFDPDLSLPFLGTQPDGSVVLGGTSTGPVELDGRTFTVSGLSDLFYLQLRP